MSFGAKTSGYRQHEIMCQNTMLVGVLLSHQTAVFATEKANKKSRDDFLFYPYVFTKGTAISVFIFEPREMKLVKEDFQ
jgi:hypothetical protein